jgi:hypothetical protein
MVVAQSYFSEATYVSVNDVSIADAQNTKMKAFWAPSRDR